MILIAHRGLFEGHNEDLENDPDQIRRCLAEGFNAEIDLRVVNGQFWLGHDAATYEVDEAFLLQRGLWIHCKNLGALSALSKVDVTPNYFWHQEDDFTLTSHGFIWTYPGKPVDPELGVWVQPEWQSGWDSNPILIPCAAVCSKFVRAIFESR